MLKNVIRYYYDENNRLIKEKFEKNYTYRIIK